MTTPSALPILKAVATKGEGIDELIEAIDDHQRHLHDSEHAAEERRELARSQVVALARAALHRTALDAAQRSGALDALVDRVAARHLDPRAAAHQLIEAIQSGWAQTE